MVITCSFNDLKEIAKDASGGNFGGVSLYVLVQGTGVTTTVLLNAARLGVVITLSNPPTQNNFLASFPGAIKVDSIV